MGPGRRLVGVRGGSAARCVVRGASAPPGQAGARPDANPGFPLRPAPEAPLQVRRWPRACGWLWALCSDPFATSATCPVTRRRPQDRSFTASLEPGAAEGPLAASASGGASRVAALNSALRPLDCGGGFLVCAASR